MPTATSRRREEAGASVFALGSVCGLAGFCAGPLLGRWLKVSAGGDPVDGAVLLAVYALGMACPLFLLAVAWEKLRLGSRSWLRAARSRWGRCACTTTNLVSGLLFVGIGVLFAVTEGTGDLGGLSDVDTQCAVQVWLQGLTAKLPDVGALIVVTLVALGVVEWRIRRHPREEAPRR